MATEPGKGRGKPEQRQGAGERERRGEAEERRARRSAGESEADDPREEEGWTQPESSAQKGAPPDEG